MGKACCVDGVDPFNVPSSSVVGWYKENYFSPKLLFVLKVPNSSQSCPFSRPLQVPALWYFTWFGKIVVITRAKHIKLVHNFTCVLLLNNLQTQML